MSITSFDANALSCIIKHLPGYEAQNFTSTCKAIRSRAFTNLFFYNLPTQLGLPFIANCKLDADGKLVRKTGTELQDDIRPVVASIIASWQSLFPNTTMRQLMHEPRSGRQLLIFQNACQEIADNWVQAPCTRFGAPEFLNKDIVEFTPEFILLLDALSRRLLASHPEQLVEDRVGDLTLSTPEQTIEDPVTKLCAFHIWLFSMMGFRTNIHAIKDAIQNMPPSLKEHAIKYSLARQLTLTGDTDEENSEEISCNQLKDQLDFFLADETIDWPKGSKEFLSMLLRLIEKTAKNKADENKPKNAARLLAQLGQAMQLIAAISLLASTSSSLLSAHIPKAINPVPPDAQSLVSPDWIDNFLANDLGETERTLLGFFEPAVDNPDDPD